MREVRADTQAARGVSLSKDPLYLAQHGIAANGGPRHGAILDDSGILWRTIPVYERDEIIGFYKLRGKSDGGLVYNWKPHQEGFSELDAT